MDHDFQYKRTQRPVSLPLNNGVLVQILNSALHLGEDSQSLRCCYLNVESWFKGRGLVDKIQLQLFFYSLSMMFSHLNSDLTEQPKLFLYVCLVKATAYHCLMVFTSYPYLVM